MVTRRQFIQGSIGLLASSWAFGELKLPVQGTPLLALRKLTNTSAHPAEFVAALQAQSGLKGQIGHHACTDLYGYNGSMLGPLIELEEGMTVEIAFTNQLDQDTTVHWHGLPVPSDQDGGPEMPVKPQETHVYRYRLPEGCAGTYWYHPHPLQGVVEQVSHGLAGPLIVRSRQDPLRHLEELHWVISDISLSENGEVRPYQFEEWIDGREGDQVLINGQVMPQITLKGTVRIRVWNCCSARYLHLSIPGALIYQVGSDGGLFAQPAASQSAILLAPGQRAELIVEGQDGQYALVLLPYDRHKMHSPPPDKPLAIGRIDLADAQTIKLPAVLRDIPKLTHDGQVHEIMLMEHMGKLMENHSGRPGRGFWLNGESFDLDRMDLHSQAGKTDKWVFINATPMDHPMHIHGGQFQIVESRYGDLIKVPETAGWYDTVNLRSGESVTLLMHQAEPGMRMYHCHILEHEELGMMGNLMVNGPQHHKPKSA